MDEPDSTRSAADSGSAPRGAVLSPDGLLVARARAGDRAAFTELYERHVGLVHAVLLSHAPARDADDLVQEVFVGAWRGLDALRDGERVGAWLSGIARNRARRHVARARPLAALPEQQPVETPAAGAAADAGEILAELTALPEAYRETLALRLVEGWTGHEIAAATGLTPGSVRVNLSRGMKLLRERLRARGWSPPGPRGPQEDDDE